MKDDMSQEKKPFSLFPEGHRGVRINELIEGKSKSGNRMFTATIEDIKSKGSMVIYLVAEPKKRWMLKSLLSACQVPAGADGVYDWEVTDVIGKTVIAVVEHYKEPWINREGKEVLLDKAKVTEFYAGEVTAEGNAVAWEE